MSRYIEADDVANAIYHHFPSISTMADARGIIEEAPSIDIVRCTGSGRRRTMSEDLIKRNSVIATIGRMYEVCTTRDITDYRDLMLEAVKVLPSADRPQGKWIDAEIPLESGGSMPIQACNLCKTFYPLAYTGGGHRFCPNCGARMKGADDEV